MAVTDIFQQQAAEKKWHITNCATLTHNLTVEADVIIVGTGAGGGVSAEVLSQAGLKVVMIEEGGLNTSDDFNMDELEAYASLYQENAARTTKDGAIALYQGRTVGGTTVINWTSCFRTPQGTLDHWQDNLSVTGFDAQAMAPMFDEMEKRLNVQKWAMAPNENNDILKRGCASKNWHWDVVPRNVSGCWNLGYCGMGCPTNAKQSMLVTTIPKALNHGASLYHHCSAHRVEFSDHKATGVICQALGKDGKTPTGKQITFKAPHIVLSGGAINNPALLLRSDAPDPHDRIGKRTMIHPVNMSLAMMPEKVDGFYGAPQSIYSYQFHWPDNNEMGFKMEVAPIHPAMGGSIMGFHGMRLTDTVKDMPYLNATLSQFRDGFHEHSVGGEISLDEQGKPVLDYPITDVLWQGFRKSLHAMAEIQFEAGAKSVMPLHSDAQFYGSWQQCKQAIDQLPLEAHRLRLMSAHMMGGCAMGEDETISVVNSQGRYHYADNLYVIDGSVFPSSIGTNPQLSIYATALKLSRQLVATIKSA